MARRRRTRLQLHRHKQAARGLARLEVQVSESDAALLREVAAALRSGSRRAKGVRSLLRRALGPPQGFLELLALDLPDEVVDAALARPKDRGREVVL